MLTAVIPLPKLRSFGLTYIKAIKKDNTSIPSLIHNDNILSEGPAKAEALNAQFSLVFTNEQIRVLAHILLYLI